MRRQLYLVTILCWLFLLPACGQQKQGAYEIMLRGMYKNTVDKVSVEQLKQKLQNSESVVLLDTRSRAEYEVSHIKGARFIDYDQFKIESLASVPKSAPIVVYCSVGYRSERIGEQLQQAGYTHVQNLYGGIFNWVNQGQPVYNAKGQTRQVHAYSRSWGIWLQKGEKVYDKK